MILDKGGGGSTIVAMYTHRSGLRVVSVALIIVDKKILQKKTSSK